jgi:hypothetical protein
MMNMTYYDYMIKPVIKQAEKSKYMAKLHIGYAEGPLCTPTFDVSVEQLKEILKILNTTI